MKANNADMVKLINRFERDEAMDAAGLATKMYGLEKLGTALDVVQDQVHIRRHE